MTEIELLKSARALIANPKNWMQAALATDENGNFVWPTDKKACRRCMQGALWAAVGYDRNTRDLMPPLLTFAESRLNRLIYRMGETCSYVTWQDDDARPHAEVLQLFDDAIRSAEIEAADGNVIDLPVPHRPDM